MSTASKRLSGDTRALTELRPRRPAKPRWRRLFLEQLESRLALANVFWNVDADGFWDVAANWKDEFNVARVPAAGDDVFLDRAAGPFTITQRSFGNTARSLHASTSQFVMSAGQFTLTADSNLNGPFALSGGNLVVSGTLTTSGATTWSGGTLSGAGTILNTGQWTLSGTSTKSLTARFENSGIVSHSGGDLQVGAVLLNQASGLYDFQGDVNLTQGGAVTVRNLGTLRKSAGSGTSGIRSFGFSNEGGTIDVRSGTLVLATSGGGVSSGGTFTVSADSVLELAVIGVAAQRYVGAYTGSGAGTVRLSSGTLAVDSAGATFNFPAGMLQWTGGVIEAIGSLNNSGFLTLDGDNPKSLKGTLNNLSGGTILHRAAGNLTGPGGGVDHTLNNQAGALYDMQGDADFEVGVFNNAGTFLKSSGAGISTMRFGHRFNHLGGTVDVRAGTFALIGTGTAPIHTGGRFLVSAGATLDLTAGSIFERQIFTGSFVSSGEGVLRLNGGWVQAGPGGATFNFPAYQWVDARVDGGPSGLTSTGVLTLVGTTGMPLLNNLINTGTMIFSAAAGDFGVGSNSFAGNGTLINQAGSVFEIQTDKYVAIESFINRGTLRKSAGTGTAFISTRSFANENGTIDVQSGTLQISGTYNSTAGGLSTGGVFMVAAGCFLDLTGLERTVRYGGSYTGSGAGTVRVRSGTLEAGPTGATFNLPPGMFQWTGGNISGGSTGFTNAGFMTLAGSDIKALSGLFNNLGTVTHTGVGDLHLGFTLPAGTFNNLAGGVYDVASGIRLRAGVFNNAGTFRMSHNGFAATDIGMRFNNIGGAIDVQKGTFLLRGTSGAPYPTHTSGNFKVAAGAFLDFTNQDGIQVFTGNYTGSGAGMVRFIGVINTGSAITIGPDGANFDFPPGLLNWTEGVIDGRAAPFTNRGSLTIDVNTTAGLNPYVRLKGTLSNEGTILHVEDGIISIDGENGLGNITNQASGVYEFQGDGRIQLNGSFGPQAAVHNFGMLRKASGAGTATIDTDSPFDNVGSVEVNAGRLLVKSPVTQVSGTTLTGGTWKVAGSGILELEDHPRLAANQAKVVLDGSASRFLAMEHVLASAGSLSFIGRSYSPPVSRIVRNFAVAVVGAGTIGIAHEHSTGNLFAYPSTHTEIRKYSPAGIEILPRFAIPGGTTANMDMDIAPESLTIGGTAVPAGTLLVINSGNATLYGLHPSTGAVLASVSLSRPPGQLKGGAYHPGTNTLFVVDGSTVFEMNPATGALLRSFPVQPAGSPAFSLSFGDLDVDPATGNLLIANGDSQAIRELATAGTFIRDQNVASLNVGRLAGLAFDDLTQHLWVCNSDGTVFELESVFNNSGNLILSPASTLVSGAFSQEASGTLTTFLGGDPASGQFGHVMTTSAATLAGTLAIELTDGFGPTTGQQFPIVKFPSATGSISSFTGLAGGRNPLFTVEHLPTSIQLSAVGSAADLTLAGFVAATFPTSATPGQSISLTYDVRNLHETALTGEWVDSLYVSQDAILDESDHLLGRVQHRGGVGGKSTYRETLTAPLPPLVDGAYRIIVLADSRGLVSEANRANNVGASEATIAVTIPLLTLGTPVTQTIASGQDRYYRLVATPGKDLKITADFAAAGVAETFFRYREPPDQTSYDQSSSANDRQQRLVIGQPQGGSYYVLIHGREGAGASSSFTIQADSAGFEIVRISPLRGSNQGSTTIEVTGSQFTPQTTLTLRHDFGDVRPAQSVQFIDANRLRANFDLKGLDAGAFRIYADDPAAPATAIGLDTFTVTDQPTGIVSLLIMSPAEVRVGMPIPVEITILNGNDSEAVAPILQIIATNVADGEQKKVVYGEGLDALPGVLPPLYEGGASVVYDPNPKADGVRSDFNLTILNPSAELINWDSQKASLRPSTIALDAWDAIWANLRPVLGNTLADLYALLQNDATELWYLGHNIRSVSQLFQFELRKANDLPAVPVPAAAADLAFPAPGVPLAFARDYGASIAERYRVGRLGRGWVDNFDIEATKDASTGLVTVRYGHKQRPFAKDKTGIYRGVPGDSATLTEVSGAFQLREKTGEVIRFRSDGLLDYLQDTSGNRITADYTGSHLASLTHTSGKALTFAYSAQGRISEVTDPTGRVATYVYDASGQHLQSVTTIEGVTEYAYTPDTTGPRAHALASIGFPAGTHLFFEYDSQGRLARQQRDGGAEPLTFTYGVSSYRVKDALDNVTIVSYDHLGLIKATWDGLDRLTIFSHNISQNLLTKVTSPEGLISSFQYDQRGNPIQTRDPMGQEQQFEYEPTFNSMSQWRDALGNSTGFSIDANGNPESTIFPDGTAEQFEYDAKGNLVRTINRRGQMIRYTYDANGLLTRKDLPDASHVVYAYDNRANLVSVTDSKGMTLMERDSAGRTTKITYPGGRFLAYSYDAGGRRTRSTDQSGFAVNYRYDTAGRLEELTDAQDQRLVLYAYDPAGRLSKETRGNGTTSSYEYDAADQLLRLVHRAPGGAVSSTFEYTYDMNGRRTSVKTLDGTTEYVYDAAGRLILVSLPNRRIIRYEYDAAGNRTVVSDDGVATAYAINDMNQYLAIGAANQAFDADGNLVSSALPGASKSYAYDAEGRLMSVVTPAGTWSYEYDAFGNRAATIHNGVRTEYVSDPSGLGNVFSEYDGSGNVRAHYAYGHGLVSRIESAGLAAYYQFDALGNTDRLTGESGAVLNAYSYLPFGEPLAASESVSNPFTFVGQLGVMREGNGLDYMRNRWYESVQGRFTQQDPMGLAGGANLYAYVGNNPVNLSDPTGLNFTWGANYTNEARAVVNYVQEGTANAGRTAGSAVRTSQTVGESASRLARIGEGISDVAHTAREAVSFSKVGDLYRAARFAEVGADAPVAAEVALITAGVVGIGVIAFELGYLQTFIVSGDTPECLSFLPSILQPYCRQPELPAGESAGLSSTIQRRPSRDPNDIFGPAGVGTNRYVAGQGALAYTIMFENVPEATGPAAEVIVTHRLDDDLDLDTFQLGDFGFGDLFVDVPEGRQFYSTRLDLRATKSVFVDFRADLDRLTRLVTWRLTALDPATLDIPISPHVGLLPPNRVQPEGQGYMNYSIRPKDGLATGTRLDAKATIVFDTNDPIETPQWFNTIDVTAPTSAVDPLPRVGFSTGFPVHWTGADGESGVATYDVFVSDNGGPYTRWLESTPLSSSTYVGADGHSYSFYALANDKVANRQQQPGSIQTITARLHPWQNPLEALDVSGDLHIAPNDVLDVINWINAFGQATQGVLPAPTVTNQPAPFYDVNGDDHAAPNDALDVINWINANPRVTMNPLSVSPEGESAASHDAALELFVLKVAIETVGHSLQLPMQPITLNDVVRPPTHPPMLHAWHGPHARSWHHPVQGVIVGKDAKKEPTPVEIDAVLDILSRSGMQTIQWFR